MRQIALVPAGCQLWNTNCTCAGGGRFAYCSTLAIYIYSLDGFYLERIIAGYEKTITALSWSPHVPDLLATASTDNHLRIWNVASGVLLTEINTLDHAPQCLDWSPHNPGLLVTGALTGAVRVWDYIRDYREQLKDYLYVAVKVVRWSPSLPGVLATGNSDGTIAIYYQQPKKMKKLELTMDGTNQKDIPIVDVQWDPLSTNFLLVANKAGVVALFDIESETELHAFDKLGSGISAVAWTPGVPGGFVTAGDRAGVLRVWNVSQKAPLDTIKMYRTGFQNLRFLPGSDSALCTFKDGTVGVYSMTKKKWEMLSEGSHTETIFGCAFKTNNKDVLATASYDASVKLWDIPTMKCTSSFQGAEGVLYSCAWGPAKPYHEWLAVSSSCGKVFIFDTEKGHVISKLVGPSEAVYRVAWSTLNPNLVAAASGDTYCYVYDLSNESANGCAVSKIKHPGGVFGCDFSPFQKDVIVTACNDGVIRLWNALELSATPLKTLRGHSSRAFNAVFSPLVPNLLLTGSDDHTVRVWDLTNETAKVLVGHTHNVRALSWSTEIPYLAFSGAWDGTIRIWDTTSGKVLGVLSAHHADVYGIASHPERPFLLASTSRDTTLRLWNARSLVAHTTASLLSNPALLPSLIADPSTSISAWPERVLLCGAQSKLLADSLPSASPVHTAEAITNFFHATVGVRDLWSLARRVVLGKSPDNLLQLKIAHSSDALDAHNARLQQLEAKRVARFTGVAAGKREDIAMEAARLAIKAGNVKHYCEIMAEYGHWDRALAIAPSHSLAYWKALCRRYAETTAKNGDVDANIYLTACQEPDRLVDYLSQRGDLEDAFLACEAAAAGKFTAIPDNDVPREASVCGRSGRAVAEMLAMREYRQGNGVWAACWHLAVSDSLAAVDALVKGTEFELAAWLASALDVTHPDLNTALALRAEKLGLWDMAVSWWRKNGRENDVRLCCARAKFATAQDLSLFYRKHGLLEPSEYELKIDSEQGLERVIFAALARNPMKLVHAALAIMQAELSSVSFDFEKLRMVSTAVASLDLAVIPEKEKTLVVGYSAYVGGFQAVWRGFYSVASQLFDFVKRTEGIAVPADTLNSALSLSLHLWSQTAVHLMQARECDAKAAASSSLAQANIDKNAKKASTFVEPTKRFEMFIKDGAIPDHSVPAALAIQSIMEKAEPRSRPYDGLEFVPLASNVPTGGKPKVSCISKAVIMGAVYCERDDGPFLSLAEAIMWCFTCPFSPLKLGCPISPF